jgi:3-oxoacyl-[acyl-carrier-protein] synthase-3
LSARIFSDGALAESLMIPGGGSRQPLSPELVAAGANKVHMKGQDIFKAAVKHLAGSCRILLDERGLEAKDIDWLCPHQANSRILDVVIEKVGFPPERVLSNLERVGNTSSASIPILLDESVREGKVQPGDNVLMCALGAGVSWGSALVTM